MEWLDGLRMRLALGQRGEPDRSSKYFAPYTVWTKIRLVALFGLACLPIAIICAYFGQIALGLAASVLFVLIVVPTPSNSLTPLMLEWIGGLLGSRYCPACGQSIFDRAPESGYMADHVRGTWWPRRICANCGHDLKVRTSGKVQSDEGY